MKALLTSIAATFVATSVWADGPSIPADPPVIPPAATAYNWTGGYGGISLGLPTGTNMWSAAAGASNATPDSWSGMRYGATLGYDHQRGNMVLGAALDVSGGNITAASTTSGTFNCVAPCTTTVSESVAVRGRIGWANDRTLTYVTAGLAQAQVAASSPGFGVFGQGSLQGWTAGLGIERAVRDNLSIGLEYLFTDLGTLPVGAPCVGGCFTDVRYGTLRLNANFRW